MARPSILFLLWTWAVVAPAAAQTPPASQVVTVFFSERPPFSIVEGQTGLLVNLTKAILSEAGMKPRFIELPPNRILEILRTGQRDALGIGWFRTSDEEAWARFSLPIYQDRPVVAMVNSRVAAQLGNPVRLDTLLTSGLTMGTKAGTSVGPFLDRKIRALGLVPLETVVDVPNLLKMIQAGRMDYTLLPEEEALYLLDRDPTLTPGLVLTRLADPPPGNFRYLLYPGGFDPSQAARIDAAIDRVRNSARYRDLISPDAGSWVR